MPQLDVHTVVDEHALLSFDDQLVIGSLAAFAGQLHDQLVFQLLLELCIVFLVIADLLQEQLVVIAGKIIIKLGEHLEHHVPLMRHQSKFVLVGL